MVQKNSKYNHFLRSASHKDLKVGTFLVLCRTHEKDRAAEINFDTVVLMKFEHVLAERLKLNVKWVVQILFLILTNTDA